MSSITPSLLRSVVCVITEEYRAKLGKGIDRLDDASDPVRELFKALIEAETTSRGYMENVIGSHFASENRQGAPRSGPRNRR